MKRAPRGYKSPVQYKVFQRINGKTRKVANYRLSQNFQNKMSLFAEIAPEAEVYVCRRGEWFKVKFTNEKQNGFPVYWEWEMVPSEGIDAKASAVSGVLS